MLLAQAPQAKVLSSFMMTPLNTYSLPLCSSGLLISSKAFGKLCSGAKTLGWERSNGTLKMISKTLEWSAIPLMDFKDMSLKIRKGCISRSWSVTTQKL
jgi:hypothetical protein